MRKYIIGMMVGAALTFAVQAGAATLLGSTIDAVIQVEVDGENLGQAPVIDGTSYLPVRKLGDAAGYEVSFEEGKATLTSENAGVVEPAAAEVVVEPISTPTEPEINYTLETISIALSDVEATIKTKKVLFESIKGINQEEDDKWIEYFAGLETELTRLKSIKATLEAQ